VTHSPRCPAGPRDSLDGALHQAFAYDSNGNRTSLTTALGTVSSSYDAQDRLIRSATSGGVVTLYAYGSNGELKTKTDSATGAQTRYQYDALGNLLKVVLPTGDSVEYLMDGQNRRVGRKWNGAVTHRWLYQNQLNPIAELDSTGAMVSRFVYGSRGNVPDYLVRGGAVYRLVTDHLGSVRAVVDTATGAVAQWTSYDAWGNVLADSGSGFQPFGFAGGMADSATGLVRFGARDYDPAVGRWTAKDPIGFRGGETNLYAYVNNAPTLWADPTGLQVIVIVVGEGIVGDHSAVWIGGFRGEPVLYDPAGSYRYGGEQRPTGDLFYGVEADLQAYVDFHTDGPGGLPVTLYEFPLPPSEQELVANAAEEQGGFQPMFCAIATSGALRASPFFEGLTALTPGGLRRDLPRAPITTYFPARPER